MATISEQQFLASLEQDPPTVELPPLLQAIRLGLRGEWETAHGIAQTMEDDADGAWVHAWLHRIEGDLGNAGYWYRRAGKPAATESTDAEGRAIARALLER
ncbi:hypothetical protein SAE02_48010 [Skermanella aerolata]|uniref:Uncharacterized protein n=1 Tax=Skermanella aerolata TaxID=393310 RepID=A0A512DW11_9PROT|nr:hypothetical protein [Skermanella aerolata]GEO40653.1 hypothetical protein SAE02_48010 [Skermanella aerolata]